MKEKNLINESIEAIVKADENQGMAIIETALIQKYDLIELLRKGFCEGNKKVGELFERGEITLPELIFSTEVMKNITEKIESLITNPVTQIKGRMLIATVDGDIHDIGKGIVVSAMRTQGLEIFDLGRSVPVDQIISKAEAYKVDIICTSALLTTTLSEQLKLEMRLKELGLRHKYKTMVGGAPCTQRWADKIGADAYSGDAIEATRVALKLLKDLKKT